MRDWIDSIEARTASQAKYDKKNTVGFYMKLNLHTDKDIIRWLWGQVSKQGSIKKLIREELAREDARRVTPNNALSQHNSADTKQQIT